jgi:outer membrane protein
MDDGPRSPITRRGNLGKEVALKHLYSTLTAVGLSLALVFCASARVHAAELKIGFIDAERINRESAPAEVASKRLEKEFAPRAQDLQRREAQIKTLQGQIEKESMTMSESDRRAKEQELARYTLDFQRLQREYREDLNLRRNQELQSLFERANRVIKQIAEAEKFDLIVQEAVYRSPRIDITERVLKALATEK